MEEPSGANMPPTAPRYTPRRAPLTISLLSLLLATACVGIVPVPAPSGRSAPPPASGHGAEPSSLARAVASLVNEERRRAGLSPLATDARLTRAAQLQADQMAETRRVEHHLPGTRYPTLDARIAAVSYDYALLAENLASGQSDAAAVVRDWMRSPGHRSNILDRGATATGVGVATDRSGVRYWSQLFAAPR